MILKMLIALACFVTAITSASVIPKDTTINIADRLQHHDLQEEDIYPADKLLQDFREMDGYVPIKLYECAEIKGPLQDSKGSLEDAEGNRPQYVCTEIKGSLKDAKGLFEVVEVPVEVAEGIEEKKEIGENGNVDRILIGTKALFNHQRFRREANPQYFNGDRGRVGATVGHGHGGGVDVNLNGQIRPWESRNRRTSVDVHGHARQTFGGPYHMRRPDYGVGVTFIHRFRR